MERQPKTKPLPNPKPKINLRFTPNQPVMPHSVTIESATKAKVKGMYVDYNEYLQHYLDHKYEDKNINTYTSILCLLIVIICLLVYIIIQID